MLIQFNRHQSSVSHVKALRWAFEERMKKNEAESLSLGNLRMTWVEQETQIQSKREVSKGSARIGISAHEDERFHPTRASQEGLSRGGIICNCPRRMCLNFRRRNNCKPWPDSVFHLFMQSAFIECLLYAFMGDINMSTSKSSHSKLTGW